MGTAAGHEDDPFADSDTDIDLDTRKSTASSLTTNEIVRKQDAIFYQHISRKNEMETAPQNGESRQNPARRKKIIDSVRDYQAELFARAKSGNVIAVLKTGSGKTLIAALLIRDTIVKEMEDRASGMPSRTTFFLVRCHLTTLPTQLMSPRLTGKQYSSC